MEELDRVFKLNHCLVSITLLDGKQFTGRLIADKNDATLDCSPGRKYFITYDNVKAIKKLSKPISPEEAVKRLTPEPRVFKNGLNTEEAFTETESRKYLGISTFEFPNTLGLNKIREVGSDPAYPNRKYYKLTEEGVKYFSRGK